MAVEFRNSPVHGGPVKDRFFAILREGRSLPAKLCGRDAIGNVAVEQD